MVLKIIFSGVVGTAVMTLVMYALAFVTKDRFKVVKILGTMLTFQTTPNKGLSDKRSAVVVGICAHYFVGISFSFIYAALWLADLVNQTFANATWLGLINGIVGAIGWRIFIIVHPNPPNLPLKNYLTAIMFGHIFFAYGILGTFLLIL